MAGKDGVRTGMKSEDISGDLGGPHAGSYKDELNIIVSYILWCILTKIFHISLFFHLQVTSRSKDNEQGEKAHSSVGERGNDDLPVFDKLSKKLQVFWIPESDYKIGQSLVSELLLSCETDLHVLFHSIGMELSPKFSTALAGDNSSDVALKPPLQLLQCPEAKKVSNLYTTLTKVSYRTFHYFVTP